MARRRVTAVLLDTHVWAWTLTGRERLSPAAIAAVEGADIVMLRAASLYEIGQKVRLGEWPEMTPLAAKLLPIGRHALLGTS